MDRATLDALHAMIVDDALGTLAPRVQAALGALTVAAALWATARPRVLPIVGFLAAAFVFARANHAFEGPILYTFSVGHGLVLADLLPVGLFGLVVVRAVGRRRSWAERGRTLADCVHGGHRNHPHDRVAAQGAPSSAFHRIDAADHAQGSRRQAPDPAAGEPA